MAQTLPHARRRADVQGLRAIASLLVAAYHVWPGAVSGGVDVFFVITGFLVVPGVVDAIAHRGPRAAARAIGRTLSRQLPMGGIVLAAVTVAVLVAWPAYVHRRILVDVVASATWWENWLLVDRSTSYLDAGIIPSPVQHFWATSVHVQVVVVLVLLVLAATLLGRRLAQPRLPLIALAAATVLSFWWALLHVLAEPDAAYFDSAARLWEFGVGALAGIGATRIRPTASARTMLGVAGLVLVLAAGQLSRFGDHPGVVTLVPVAGAVALLVAGTAPGGIATRMLTWRPLVAIGGLSWGLYLWCWPLLMAYRLVAPERAATHPIVDGVLLIVASGALSWASGRLIAVLDRAARWRPSRLALPLVATGAVVLAATAGTLPTTPPTIGSIASVQQAQAQIETTVAASDYAGTEWLGEAAQAPEWVEDDCLDVGDDRVDRCVYGPEDAALEIAVVGDSHAVSWLPGLRAGLPDARIQVLTRGMCTFSTVTTLGDPDHWRMCQDHADWATDRILADEPDLVIVANGQHSLSGATDDGVEVLEPSVTLERLAAGTVERLAPVTGAGVPVLWLDGAPPNSAYASCAVPFAIESIDARCTVDRVELMAARVVAFTAAAADVPAIRVADQTGWWCSLESGLCPVTIDGMLVTADGNHLSWMLSTAYGPLLASEVAAALQRRG